uniref:Isoaspartyl peptidase/L-asparaginase n=1 Tax=candidate division WOR-3 bacterium TaxID=2052148 RepID=A0A7C4CEJ0_UNCW3
MNSSRPIGIICHGGAGTVEDPAAAAAGLKPAIEEGYRLLLQGAPVLDVVVTAVRMLEDSGLFNAGTGSDLTIDEHVEMDAAVMTQDGRFGGVCCIAGVRNPILVAEKVMTDTDHLLLAGEGAFQFAQRAGLAGFHEISERARRRLARVREQGSPFFPKLNQQLRVGDERRSAAPETDTTLGTVGAVAIDRQGKVAAATSSGGVAGKMRGRVGDSALPGAGTYAAPAGAVSCSGHGEGIIRILLAKDIVDRMTNLPGATALTLALAEARRKKVMCGAVGFDARGGICYGHTTPHFIWGYKIANRLFMFTDGAKSAPKVG